MKVIPSIDIIENKVVRLEKGDYNKMRIYSDSVLEVAKTYEKNGFNLIHIVDLIGSKSGEIQVTREISNLKSHTNLSIQFGGGIRSQENVQKLFDLGVDKVVIGSMSVNNRNEFEKILNLYGTEKLVIASDVKDNMIAVKGWTEKSEITLNEQINYCLQLGIKEYLVTDISKDGMLTGPATELYVRLQREYKNINIIASGGVSSKEDLLKLKRESIYASVVGRAYYENKITLEEMKEIAV